MDPESFKEAYLPYHPKLYRIAFAMLGNNADAEDILQETYLKLWNMREQLPGVRNAEAFAVTMTQNLCLDLLRSPGADKHSVREENIAFASDMPPDGGYQQRNELELVKRLIEALPEQQKMILRLRGIEGLALEEIERITGLSAANVRTTLSRARKTIREQYNRMIGHGR